MASQENRLISVDLAAIPTLHPKVLIIGDGVAGLSAALSAARYGSVLLINKDSPSESNTYYAQGGVATALGSDDTPQLHMQDTINAGAGLCDSEAVKVLVEEGTVRCQELIDMGTPFDREKGDIAFTMEGAHCRRRVIHADGDATGKVMVESLLQHVRDNSNITFLENHFAVDLLHAEGECFGALVLDNTYGRLLRVDAAATIVATGGIGQIYRETTNPEIATGDGIAMCFRAGAVLRDMEFVQFHPTTLYLAGAPRFLISESVRGEGAHLLNLSGERFMKRYDKEEELAPRDVVSQAIFKETKTTNTTHVNLDLRHLGTELINRRFPTIKALCANYGINLESDVIPVRPAMHYMMGGVKTDLDARTNIKRLYAVGEVASTCVHGANRLASNSLLEGLVFGHRAGLNAINETGRGFPCSTISRALSCKAVPLDIDDVELSLKSLAWRQIGLFRTNDKLLEAERIIQTWEKYVLPEQFQARRGFEIQNMLTTAKIIGRAALMRTESRGAHQRLDYPETSEEWEKHIELHISDFE